MCGIVGILSAGPMHHSELKRMTDAMRHRGPDGDGFFVAGAAVPDIHLANIIEGKLYPLTLSLGHRRLMIQDLSEKSIQPMPYGDRYVITFNGEIYNYIELKKELMENGYRFETATDTEVIMAAYDLWGVECLNRFNGMWAFLLYDRTKHELFISRDRFAKKPLYYYRSDRALAFASEIKALLESRMVATQPNVPYLKRYLQSGSSEFEPETAFANIHRFPKASFSRIRIADSIPRRLEFKRYWRLFPETKDQPYDENKADNYASEYYRLLRDSVNLRLRAAVKVGVNLSGGLDSSSIAYLTHGVMKEKGENGIVETFSSVYSSPEFKKYDESDFIEHVVRMLDLHSNRVEPNETNVIDEHRKMVLAMESPSESTSMSSWHTFKRIKECGFRVVLDGQGADEQLAGYISYLISYFFNRKNNYRKESLLYHDIPQSRNFVAAGIRLREISRLVPRWMLRRAFVLAGSNTERMLYALNQVLANDMNRKLVNFFHYVDSISMAFSVESRAPFMDYRLVEFLAKIPGCYKIHGGWTKFLARRAFAGKLPDSVVWRRDKMQWPTPEEAWFSGELRRWLLETLLGSAFLRECQMGSEQIGHIVDSRQIQNSVRLLNLAVWHETFFPSRPSFDERKDSR